MKIRDIMISEIETAEPDDTLDEIAILMREQDVGAIPVVENGELIGIVTDRDIVVRCIAEGRDPAEVAVDEILTGDLHTIEPEAEVEQARRIMAEHHIRRLPVVERGMLVGMVSLIDEREEVGDTLRGISEGVKVTDRSATRGGRKQPKTAAISARQMSRAHAQRDRDRVVPIRSQQKTNVRGEKRSKPSSRHKTG
jgi:CBS domain-containing protein